ncbi:MAG TPA: PKD domain-containing protein, partial [Deltaproteobacteria bacterium]|nr:PKD domain-containing protein [Deltaproteobacteria bacterium]
MKALCVRSLLRISVLVFLVHLLVGCSQCSEKPEVPVEVEQQVQTYVETHIETEAEPETLSVAIDSSAKGRIIYEGESAVFSGSVSGGIPPYVYDWDFSGNAPRSGIKDPGEVIFSSAGSYEILFSVQDSSGIEVRDSTVIEIVKDTSPLVKIVSPGADTVIPEGLSIAFSATVSGGNPPLTYEWDFSALRAPLHKEDPGNITFPDAGSYPVRLTVRDRDGDEHSASVSITVEKNIPNASITSPE